MQCLGSQGDSFSILGGKRLDTADLTTNSFQITITASTIRVEGFYPMQRMSDPYIYLRTDANSSNMEMSVLDSARNPSPDQDIMHSNILAKVYRDTEFCSFISNGSLEYFANLQTRTLSSLRLFLTDSKGRRLGRTIANSGQGSAAGLEDANGNLLSTTQNTDGNLSFTAVIRVDILRVSDPRNLESAPPPAPQPAHEAQTGVLTWQAYGRPKY